MSHGCSLKNKTAGIVLCLFSVFGQSCFIIIMTSFSELARCMLGVSYSGAGLARHRDGKINLRVERVCIATRSGGAGKLGDVYSYLFGMLVDDVKGWALRSAAIEFACVFYHRDTCIKKKGNEGRSSQDPFQHPRIRSSMTREGRLH